MKLNISLSKLELSYTKNYSIMNNRTKYSIFVDIQKIKIKFKLPIHLWSTEYHLFLSWTI